MAVLPDTLQLKKVAFADDVLEQAKAQGQRADDFDGSVLIKPGEVGPLITDLIDALDGLLEVGVAAPASAPVAAAPASPAALAPTDRTWAARSSCPPGSEDDGPPFVERVALKRTQPNLERNTTPRWHDFLASLPRPTDAT